MGSTLHRRSRSEPSLELCQQLDSVAKELLKGSEKAKKLVAGVSEELIQALFPERILAALIAKKFAGYILKPLTIKIEGTAQALRAYGVLICAISGDLSRCPCLRAIMKPVIKEHIEEAVRDVVSQSLGLLRV